MIILFLITSLVINECFCIFDTNDIPKFISALGLIFESRADTRSYMDKGMYYYLYITCFKPVLMISYIGCSRSLHTTVDILKDMPLSLCHRLPHLYSDHIKQHNFPRMFPLYILEDAWIEKILNVQSSRCIQIEMYICKGMFILSVIYLSYSVVSNSQPHTRCDKFL